MIQIHFWPSIACDSNSWELAINRALQSQSEFFNANIAVATLHPSCGPFHLGTSGAIGEQLIIGKYTSSIHFIQVEARDVQEEFRDSFPESFLHLDILARLSRHNVIAVIDLINSDHQDLKDQLNSVTKVLKTCTIVENFANPPRARNEIKVRQTDNPKLEFLAYESFRKLLWLRDRRNMCQEP